MWNKHWHANESFIVNIVEASDEKLKIAFSIDAQNEFLNQLNVEFKSGNEDKTRIDGNYIISKAICSV